MKTPEQDDDNYFGDLTNSKRRLLNLMHQPATGPTILTVRVWRHHACQAIDVASEFFKDLAGMWFDRAKNIENIPRRTWEYS